ncbi:Mobile element protein [Nitrincola lacisaponensis]|uniref:Mobile element protein n=1 Tax=Nitrincola lacisaponensis TaxID=267850 RepID=A0A063XYF2_9GAMM|nr:transposase [Nitrincola lacisaponensis]KDE38514.1 Mobile element protein [Nitrincola lacisaponensis]
MARYKHYDYNQTKMIPLRFADQIQPGTFEYTLNHVVDNDLDLSVFESRYRNDVNGAPAYDPAILLKVVLFAYSRGITSSRKIAQACRENVIFMALSADSQPHHSTIAEFISRMDEVIAPLFTHVLMVCDGLNLIGREMFAIDGCKLPSNAAKEWSGTRAELNRKQAKIDRAVSRMLTVHQQGDHQDQPPEILAREQAQIEKLEKVSAKIKKHLATAPERLGQRGTPIKGNITDPDSANIKLIYHLGIDGYIADNQFRKCDPRFAESVTFNKAQAQRRKERGGQVAQRFTPAEFNYDPLTETCRCPVGQPMWKRFKGLIGEQETISFQVYRQHCRDCSLKHQCLRRPNQQDGQQVSFTLGERKLLSSFIEKMKQKIDSPMGRHIYSQRLGTVEPVFGNLESNKGLNRFTLRGKSKVNAQWMMYCMVHNLEKIATQGQQRH